MNEQKPLILITNDDGIDAPGIRELVGYVKEMGEIVVIARMSLIPGNRRRFRSTGCSG